jgi:hypothetical protein
MNRNVKFSEENSECNDKFKWNDLSMQPPPSSTAIESGTSCNPVPVWDVKEQPCPT